MLKPPRPWPFTGRFYPEGAELVMVKLCKCHVDLCYRDKNKGNVYLSTLTLDKAEKLDTILL